MEREDVSKHQFGELTSGTGKRMCRNNERFYKQNLPAGIYVIRVGVGVKGPGGWLEEALMKLEEA